MDRRDTPGREAVTNERCGVAPSVAFGIGTPLRIMVDYTHLDQEMSLTTAFPVPPANVPIRAWADSAPPVDFSNFYGLTSRDYNTARLLQIQSATLFVAQPEEYDGGELFVEDTTVSIR